MRCRRSPFNKGRTTGPPSGPPMARLPGPPAGFRRRLTMRSCVSVLFTLAAALLLYGCNGMARRSSRASAGTGMLQVRLTDAPIDLTTVRSVNVTITGVTVFPEESTDLMTMLPEPGPIPLMTHPATFDLLTLTGGATALLASGEAPAGAHSPGSLDIFGGPKLKQGGTLPC